ncbi:MAG: nucleotidyltransferase domain-containing protein [Synergistaceae bacterium]|jgi:predicted nucleotidyltransferase|nr:nucleotidyltransferase domain-containing protein [Synergistaceae bacterium]
MSVITAPIRLKSAWEEIDQVREKSLEAFVEKLKAQEGENLLRVVLFGSVARGDSREDSDTDVFVLLKEGEKAKPADCDRIVGVAVDVDLEEGECRTCISPIVYSLKEYRRNAWIPLFENIEEEGIVLYDVGAGE